MSAKRLRPYLRHHWMKNTNKTMTTFPFLPTSQHRHHHRTESTTITPSCHRPYIYNDLTEVEEEGGTDESSGSKTDNDEDDDDDNTFDQVIKCTAKKTTQPPARPWLIDAKKQPSFRRVTPTRTLSSSSPPTTAATSTSHQTATHTDLEALRETLQGNVAPAPPQPPQRPLLVGTRNNAWSSFRAPASEVTSRAQYMLFA